MLGINVEIVPRILLMGFVSYTTPWIHFKRCTDEYVLYVIKSGELHIKENGIDYVLKRGDVLLLEPNMAIEGTEKYTCDYYYFHFKHPDIVFQLTPDLSVLARRSMIEESDVAGRDKDYHDSRCYFPKRYTLPDKKSFHQTMHAMNELLQLYHRKHFNRSLTALRFSELLIELSREHLMSVLQNSNGKSSRSIVKVHALLDYIHNNYTQKIMSTHIEQEMECNFDYMNRIFKHFTGYTITRYINKVRIQHAQELIQATHISFSEIGYLTGLNDPYYFSKVFKQYVGLSPMQYYKKIRE